MYWRKRRKRHRNVVKELEKEFVQSEFCEDQATELITSQKSLQLGVSDSCECKNFDSEKESHSACVSSVLHPDVKIEIILIAMFFILAQI